MCRGVFDLDAFPNHATFPRARKTRKTTSIKRFTRLESENHPLTLEKRHYFELKADRLKGGGLRPGGLS